jgi:hypothetical protein
LAPKIDRIVALGRNRARDDPARVARARRNR